MSGVSRHLIGAMANHFQGWLTANSVPDSRVAWPNRPMDPPAVDGSVAWYRATFFPSETRQAGVGDNGFNEMGGIMLINVFYPKGKNSGTPNELADSIISYFKRGTLTSAVSGYQARISSAWRDAALPDEVWYMIPVRIRYFQHVTNS